MNSTRINVTNSIDHVRRLLDIDNQISPGLKAAIETIILALEIMLEKTSKNSKNSHKPPSTDLQRRPAFPRRRKKRSHPGSTIEQQRPDEVIVHHHESCPCCHGQLGKENLVNIERRQIIDIVIQRKIIEHQAEVMFCYCGKLSMASFPEGLNRHIQYSSNIKAKISYLYTAQLLPYNRIASDFLTTAEIKISEGTIFNFLCEAYQRLELWELSTIDELLEEKSLHLDETGMMVNKKNHWVHSYSSMSATILKIHVNRGANAPMDIGILPNYDGTIIHDCWPTYFKFNNQHALCGAHIIRELDNAYELPKQDWAKQMKDLLVDTNDIVNRRKSSCLFAGEYIKLEEKYDLLIKRGMTQTKFKRKIINKKGSTKEEKAISLLSRLTKYKDSVLRFAKDKDIPFTNNMAERDLRMSKVKQKISGGFRSFLGAQIYCRLRSYMLTQQKNGEDPFTAFKKIFENSD